LCRERYLKVTGQESGAKWLRRDPRGVIDFGSLLLFELDQLVQGFSSRSAALWWLPEFESEAGIDDAGYDD
jgi:hypothetical protein